MSIANLPHIDGMPSALREWLTALRLDVIRQRRPLYIPITQFSGFHRINTIGAYYSPAPSGSESIRFDGTGTPLFAEINSLGIVGAKIDAVTDACDHLFYVPKDFNVDTNTKYEVVWTTSNNVTTNTATWGVTYSAAASGETLAAATTALDSVITADAVLGAYKVAVSPEGVMYAAKLEHGDLLHLKVSLDAVAGLDPAVDSVYLLGILIDDGG